MTLLKKTPSGSFDGHGIIHRAYHAFKEPSSCDDGEVTAVYGLRTRSLASRTANLTHIARFDPRGPTFRHDLT
jgi:5'-3' exonuclease